MTDRNLLHKTKVEAFLAWLDARGMEHRAPSDNHPYQIAQIKVGKHWQALYRRDTMPEHVTVPNPLGGLVRQFLKESK